MLLAAALLAPAAALAQSESDVKAAYAFRFLSFVEWPARAFPRPETPITVGVLGADDVAAALEQIAPGRVVQGRPVAVRRVREGDGFAGLHALYVGRAANGALARAKEEPALLVVSDTEGALERGAVINLLRSEGRIRFEVALDAAEARGLRLSSRMLSLAYRVRQGAP